MYIFARYTDVYIVPKGVYTVNFMGCVMCSEKPNFTNVVVAVDERILQLQQVDLIFTAEIKIHCDFGMFLWHVIDQEASDLLIFLF